MRIAVIGAGVSGMTAAHRLSRAHDVTVYEAGGHIGGHTNTVDVEYAGRVYAVDTGFIVYNDWTYPKFSALLEELRVPWQPSQMSFSVRCEKSGLEYNGTSVNSLFAQRRNFARPSFLRMVADILRFNRRAPRLLAAAPDALSLGDYLDREGYSHYFVDHYIIPMGAAIWSSRPVDMLYFPARFFVEFFANHGFLSVDARPTWRVIRGGSREYVKRLTAPYAARIHLNTPVASLQRQPNRVVLRLKDGGVENFDQVFIACHSDQALNILSDPSREEREILGAIAYQSNEALLHTDASLMPRRPLAWAAWNYHLPIEQYERVTVTYNMNILQAIDAPAQFLLTLNRGQDVDPSKVLGRYVYHHPVYTAEAVAAQRRRREINGARHTYYCGAYWGYGFHEDGVTSACVSLEELQRRQAYEQPHLQRVG
ncbi:MAG: FAD-dependent oxidoreductase [Pseudomonadota bacterium]|nr:FAD-dependent oxidoreductase [Pseudomonadota bacterium]